MLSFPGDPHSLSGSGLHIDQGPGKKELGDSGRVPGGASHMLLTMEGSGYLSVSVSFHILSSDLTSNVCLFVCLPVHLSVYLPA